jgi:DNA polymerase-3 subunit alpha
MTEEKFVHLHNHSYFSLLDGLSSTEDLVECASDLGYKSLALTDHGSCAGLFQFQKACEKKGIKPILGMEAYVTDDHSIAEKIEVEGQKRSPAMYHLVLLAKNKVGYKNLIFLSSFGYIHGFYYRPRIDFDILKEHSEGLIVTSACAAGEISPWLEKDREDKAEEVANRYREVFGDDFYIEIMSHSYKGDKTQEEREKKLASRLYKLSKKLGIKAICTQDTHYARKEDWEAHDVLLSIQTLDTIKNPNRMTFSSDDFYLKPYEQMAELYKKAPELLSNTVEIADKIETGLIEASEDLLPNFELPDGFKKEEDYLKELVKNGMKEKGLINKPEYRERVKYEMSVITKCNYTKYFLILWDIINFARSEGIRVGPGRGSAVSSLCLYVLGITKLDPIKYGLIFERFLNPDRISPPDVDIDFDYDRREEVYNYIVQKYGTEYCSQIGTYNKLMARQAIRSTVKALDLGKDWDIMQEKKAKNPDAKVEETKNSLDLADRIAKMVPFKAGTKIQGAMKSVEELRRAMHKYPQLLAAVLKIEGTLKSAGVHPAGILVCKDPVIEHVPLRVSNGVICSQYDGPEVEYLGLLKFDLLALKTLTVVEKTVQDIKRRHKKVVDVDSLEPEDPEVFKIFNGEDPRKDTRGVFQFEASGISRLLAAIHVDRFEDMIVANALYRPGPLGAGVHDMYCNFKHGRQEIKYLHPKMGEALKDTYGIMCFHPNQIVYTDTGPVEMFKVKHHNVYCLKNSRLGKDVPSKDAFINGRKEVYRYTLSNGREIWCTKDHKILTDNGYKQIDDIYSKGGTIPYKLGRISDKKTDPITLKKNYLLGALIGDGNTKACSPILCVGKDKEYGEKVADMYKLIYGKDACSSLFYATRSWYVRFTNSSNCNKFGNCKSNGLMNELREMNIDCLSKHKFIPFSHVCFTRDSFLALLAGLIDTHGSIQKDIYYSSSSHKLLIDFEYIMWRLGYTTYRSHHTVHVYESASLFKEIKKYLIKKKNSLVPTCNGQRIKLDSKIVSKFLKSKIGKSSQREFCKKYRINRSTLRRILKCINSTCQKQSVDGILSNDEINEAKVLTVDGRDYFERCEVYDLSMPSSEHNFMIADGIVAHNCFQENIMKISQVLAGFTGAQADTLRKAVGKKIPELLKKQKELFVKGCIKNGVKADIAEKIFAQIDYFAGYGFNKSHSAAYAFLAYQTAWLKRYYPVEFMCNLLTNEINDEDKLRLYLNQASKMEIICMPEDINESGLEFKIQVGYHSNGEEMSVLRKPLTGLKGVGGKAVKNIVDNQPFSDLEDFLKKIDARLVNSAVFAKLAKSGCMKEAFGLPEEHLLSRYEEVKKKINKEKKVRAKQEKKMAKFQGQSLFDSEPKF